MHERRERRSNRQRRRAQHRPSERIDRGGERELTNGKRDRSRDMLREELTRNLDDAARRSGRPRDWEPADRPAREAREAAAPKAKDRDRATDAGVQQQPAPVQRCARYFVATDSLDS